MRQETRRRVPVGLLGLAAVLLAGVSCSLLPRKQSPTEKRLAQSGLTIDTLQIEVLRFADDYVESVSHATDTVAKTPPTREAGSRR